MREKKLHFKSFIIFIGDGDDIRRTNKKLEKLINEWISEKIDKGIQVEIQYMDVDIIHLSKVENKNKKEEKIQKIADMTARKIVLPFQKKVLWVGIFYAVPIMRL